MFCANWKAICSLPGAIDTPLFQRPVRVSGDEEAAAL